MIIYFTSLLVVWIWEEQLVLFTWEALSGLGRDLMLEVEVNSLKMALNIWTGDECLVSVFIVWIGAYCVKFCWNNSVSKFSSWFQVDFFFVLSKVSLLGFLRLAVFLNITKYSLLPKSISYKLVSYKCIS